MMPMQNQKDASFTGWLRENWWIPLLFIFAFVYLATNFEAVKHFVETNQLLLLGLLVVVLVYMLTRADGAGFGVEPKKLLKKAWEKSPLLKEHGLNPNSVRIVYAFALTNGKYIYYHLRKGMTDYFLTLRFDGFILKFSKSMYYTAKEHNIVAYKDVDETMSYFDDSINAPQSGGQQQRNTQPRNPDEQYIISQPEPEVPSAKGQTEFKK